MLHNFVFFNSSVDFQCRHHGSRGSVVWRSASRIQCWTFQVPKKHWPWSSWLRLIRILSRVISPAFPSPPLGSSQITSYESGPPFHWFCDEKVSVPFFCFFMKQQWRSVLFRISGYHVHRAPVSICVLGFAAITFLEIWNRMISDLPTTHETIAFA